MLVLLLGCDCECGKDAPVPEEGDKSVEARAAALWAKIQSPLSAEETRVIRQQGTERSGPGGYTNADSKGLYVCRACGSSLYRSESKFHSGCGWPAFDDEINGAVRYLPDPDGARTEIRCAACDGHLGHVFTGEAFTETNMRHCVNSISMLFIPAAIVDEYTKLRAAQSDQ
ncbi:MAG: hypothetical protein HN909_05990 [Phycisphaerales bacterium]|nr:hypothetical protein [Phycisphaerales bacterium]MBT7171304.1 hypothetical protein [Phycisphaerales bacterium]